MYPSLRETGAVRAGTLIRPWHRASRNVVLLGATSLFTDISSEMLTAVLPLYFMLELRMSPLEFGVIDGLYHGVSALVRLASGVVADRGGHYKAMAVAGYAISAVCKLLLLMAGTAWAPITAILMVDRLGKGIRTAPRDALITLSSDRARLGEAFGVHRAMLGLLTASDAMVYMLLQSRGAVSATVFPLLFVGTSVTYLLLAMPFGRLGDRIGKHRLFLIGHLAVVCVYGVLLSPMPAVPAAVAAVVLLGVYYASTDGILAALAGGMLRHADLTTGLALVTTVTAIARLLAASVFGASWTWGGASGALGAFGAGLVISLVLAAVLLDVGRAWPTAAEV